MAANGLPGPDTITRVVLDNGVIVLVYQTDAAQSVVISGSLKVGSMLESPAQNGLSSMTAAALMRGTERRDFNAIHTELEDIGADISISSGVHRTSFFGKALAEDLNTLVDVFADVVRRPTFPDSHVERLRGEILTGLQYRSQDTRYRANRAFHEALYPANHPYHYSVRGSIETVSKLSVEDLRNFHKQRYSPQGMIFVVVGAVKADKALEIIQQHLSDWNGGSASEQSSLPEVQRPAQTQRSFVPLPGKTQSDIVMGLPGPSRFAPDYHAANLANSILGQFGMMGRIGESVREELGLAYYAYSQLEGGLGEAPWSISAGVNPANVELAIERINDELRRLTSEPVSDTDLADNQSYFVGHLPLQLESNEGIAGTLHNMELFNLGLDYLLTYRDRIYSLTKDDLLAAARRYLNPDALVIGIAGPETTG
ncbi:MAG TPA: pitrilysin family protein [Oceanobacillus sp.]|nr:pitrilysin family protein [Oceanobacillus sp.]